MFGIVRRMLVKVIRSAGLSVVLAFLMAAAPAARGSTAADTIAERGNQRFARGDVEGAINDYSQAIKTDGRCVKAFHGRATVRARYGRLDDALTDYGRAIELQPDFRPAFLGRGMTFQAS